MCEAILIAEHPIHDVALLKLDLPNEVNLPYFEFEESHVQINQWVYIGYFDIVENRVLLRGGKCLSYVYSNVAGFSCKIHTSVSTYSGDSGGPWFQQDGKIVGVHKGSWGYSQKNSVKYSFFLPYTSFRDWLVGMIGTPHKVEEAFAPPPPTTAVD